MVRATLLLSTAALISYEILDLSLATIEVPVMRGFIFLLGLTALSWTSTFRRTLQPILAAMVLLTGAQLVALANAAGEVGLQFYFPALFMLLTFSYTLLQLRFVWTQVACWPVIAMASLTLFADAQRPIELLYMFFLVVMGVLGSAISYAYEHSKRRTFQRYQQDQEKVDEIKRLNQRLNDIAIRDPLTGLYNRRELMNRLSMALSLHRRYGTPATVLLLDLDDFKEINDTHGHPVGDRVLVQISALLQLNSRDSDMVFRYGGDEFLILLQNTRAADVMPLWERIRAALQRMEIPIAFSGGATELSVATADAESLLKEIDDALYQVKRG